MSSLTKYVNSTPKDIQATVPANQAQISKDFTLFVDKYRPSTVVNTEDVPTGDLPLFKEVLLSLFHTVYVMKSGVMEDSFGSGNYQLVKLNRDGGTYYLELYGVRHQRIVHAINDAQLTVSGDALKVTSNNGLSLTVMRTGVKSEFGGEQSDIWQLTLTNNNNLVFRYHTVVLTM